MCARISQNLRMIFQPRSGRQEKWRVAAAVAKVDRRALLQEVAQDFDVRSGRREVLYA